MPATSPDRAGLKERCISMKNLRKAVVADAHGRARK